MPPQSQDDKKSSQTVQIFFHSGQNGAQTVEQKTHEQGNLLIEIQLDKLKKLMGEFVLNAKMYLGTRDKDSKRKCKREREPRGTLKKSSSELEDRVKVIDGQRNMDLKTYVGTDLFNNYRASFQEAIGTATDSFPKQIKTHAN